MDWLSNNGAILDCERRVVRLVTRLGNTLEIYCNPMGPVMLCYLESLDSSIDDLQLVRVVREYPDVFDEVKGLPPKCEIDFRILLIMLSQLHCPLDKWPREREKSLVSKLRSCLRKISLGEAFLNGVLW